MHAVIRPLLRRALVIMLALSGATAHAELIQVVAVGKNIAYYDPDGLLPFTQPGANAIMRMTVIYDSDAQDTLPGNPGRGFYNAITNITLEIGAWSTASLGNDVIQVYDNLSSSLPTDLWWAQSNGDLTDPTKQQFFDLAVNRNDGTAIHSDALVPPFPAPWNTARISYQVLDVTNPAESVTRAIAYARIDSITVTTVPLPAAAWLFGGALGALGLARRRAQGR